MFASHHKTDGSSSYSDTYPIPNPVCRYRKW